MFYTIGQVSEMFDLPISTLRYYDKEGLFPVLERKSGIRKFGAEQFSQEVQQLVASRPCRAEFVAEGFCPRPFRQEHMPFANESFSTGRTVLRT